MRKQVSTATEVRDAIQAAGSSDASDAEKIVELAECLSDSLKSPCAKSISQSLEQELAGKAFPPLATQLVHSFTAIHRIDTPLHIAVVLPAYGKGPRAFNRPSDFPELDQLIRAKMQQLDRLLSVNGNISWRLIVVKDEAPGEPSVDGIIEAAARSNPSSGTIKGLTLSAHEIESLGSCKGGNVVLGMKEALSDGSDCIVYTDPTSYIGLSQLGVLVFALHSMGKDVAVGSRSLKSSIRKRSWYRRLSSLVYRTVTAIYLPELEAIRDTQCGFKGFTSQAARAILPIDDEGRFTRDFVYNLSFDTNLLGVAGMCVHWVTDLPLERDFYYPYHGDPEQIRKDHARKCGGV